MVMNSASPQTTMSFTPMDRFLVLGCNRFGIIGGPLTLIPPLDQLTLQCKVQKQKKSMPAPACARSSAQLPASRRLPHREQLASASSSIRDSAFDLSM